ncbi:L,D-transpeptidase [Pseudogemmobacter bohemicus]|uniref:L,D-transpeptidase n=1 Tax=Pseudogemmobacter bohemicus TaxID=2250708 RepID=UPI0018E5124D|nr:L,D-transpeptidase [Pseudogemmobacter bohemicus]
MPNLSGAAFLALSLFAMTACVPVEPTPTDPAAAAAAAEAKAETARAEAQRRIAFAPVSGDVAEMYAAREDGGQMIAGIDPAKMNPDHVRRVIAFQTEEAPGTIIVDQGARVLYFVMPEGKALRYAIGVGPDAMRFDGGDAIIDRKQAWPRWIPTADMVKRNPGRYLQFKDGVPGGISNPLGARALYMQKDGRDTYYRVHGTNDPSSVGRAVSAGCIRMLNQDVIDLHARVSIGAKIVVR